MYTFKYIYANLFIERYITHVSVRVFILESHGAVTLFLIGVHKVIFFLVAPYLKLSFPLYNHKSIKCDGINAIFLNNKTKITASIAVVQPMNRGEWLC